ncbi:MAG: phage portal protein [Clostridiales bacterium]|nr:phage portal protein [Clostridiales bacterium]
MGIFNILGKVKEKVKNHTYAKMMNGYTPVFTQFGNNVYASDIVQGAIRCIQDDISKLNPKHIRIDPNTGLQSVINDNINKLLKYGPNPLMTTTDFLEKIVYLREINKNVFIYPSYNIIKLGKSKYKREYTGLWPLNPIEAEFQEDAKGELYIKFTFTQGDEVTLPYKDIIHWRKDFGSNDFAGGDINGQANNDALLKLLETNDYIMQGMKKGIKASLSVKGIMKINTMLDDEEQEKKRIAFEEKMKNSESGILPMDIKGDYIPINLDPKMIDKDTMEFIDKRILANYGVSIKIFNGDFTEEDYQAYFEKKLEPMIIGLGRAFTKVLFTDRELDVGNEIIFYQQGLMYMNTANKINAVDILTRLGTITDNEVLAAFGYPPFEGGDVRHMSLNYINRDIADQYQLANSTKKAKGSEPVE